MGGVAQVMTDVRYWQDQISKMSSISKTGPLMPNWCHFICFMGTWCVQMSKLLGLNVFFRGTNWGGLAYPGVYTRCCLPLFLMIVCWTSFVKLRLRSCNTWTANFELKIWWNQTTGNVPPKLPSVQENRLDRRHWHWYPWCYSPWLSRICHIAQKPGFRNGFLHCSPEWFLFHVRSVKQNACLVTNPFCLSVHL